MESNILSHGKITNWGNWKPEIAFAMQAAGFSGPAALNRAISTLGDDPKIRAVYPDIKDHAHANRAAPYVYASRRPVLSAYYNGCAKDIPYAQPGRLKQMPEMISLALGVPYSSIFARPEHLPACKTLLEEQGFYDIP